MQDKTRLKKPETGKKNSEIRAIVKPCPYCARLERALHDAIKMIEGQEKTIKDLLRERETVKP